MQQLITFAVVYNYDRTNKLRSNGTASVLIRAYQSGKYSYFNTGVYVAPEQWCKRNKRVKNHPRERRLNAIIQQFQRKLEEVEAEISFRTGNCSVSRLKESFNQNYNQSFIAFYRAQLKEERNRIAQSSYRNFTQTLSYLESFAPELTFSQITQSFVRSFQHYLFDQGLKHNTVQKHFRFLRKYVNIAVQQKLIRTDNNPFKALRMGAQRTEIVFLTEEEFRTFEAYEPPADKSLWRHVQQCFLFCCYTGLRFCDLCQLTSKNFYETADGFFMQIARLRKTKKPYLQNIRYLFQDKKQGESKPEAIVKEIFQAHDYRPGDSFCRITYDNANSYRRILKLIAEKLKLRPELQQKIGTHTARHTFGSYLASRIDIVVLKDLMGHSNISETMIYVHLTQKRKEEALKNVNW